MGFKAVYVLLRLQIIRRGIHQQIAADIFAVISKISHGCAAGALPVNGTAVAFIHIDELLYLSGKRLKTHVKIDLKELKAVIESVQMVMEPEGALIPEIYHLVAGISEKYCAVQHRHPHFLKGSDIAVIITYVLHFYASAKNVYIYVTKAIIILFGKSVHKQTYL